MPRLAERLPSVEKAPIYDENGFPYNYIIIIDAGSKGTRAFLYGYKSKIHYVESNTPLDDDNTLPQLIYCSNWYKKIKPSIESSIIENGLHSSNIINYLNHLIFKIYNVLPIEQHYRTPVFFHATAGLRVLDPYLQDKLLFQICNYFQSNTDFFIPDCNHHVNVLDGDIEGLYSWVTLNYLLNNQKSIDVDSSYGLLALGGGSAQICFKPNDESIINSIQLINLQLDKSYQLYSTSFLGFGLNQLHQDYLNYLIENHDASNANNDNEAHRNFFIIDPCLPKDYSTSYLKYTIHGSSDFISCKFNIINQIIENDNRCDILGDDSSADFKISDCMLNNLSQNLKIDLNTDKFIAISGYYDTINELLTFNDEIEDDISGDLIYNPKKFIDLTIKICNSNFNDLNNDGIFPNIKHLSSGEISNLCFKSTYIASLLHSGFGLSIDDSNKQTLLIKDKINDFKFSWTLGRAVLYAIDESSKESKSDSKVGYFKNLSPNLFIYGSEQSEANQRPKFQIMEKYPTFTFNIDNSNSPTNIPINELENFDNYDNNDDTYSDNDDIEILYQPKSHFWNIVFTIFSTFLIFSVLLLLIPSFRRWIILKIHTLRGNNYSMLQNHNDSNGTNHDRNLRKFHNTGNDHLKDSNIELQNFNSWDVNDNSINDVVSDSEFIISDNENIDRNNDDDDDDDDDWDYDSDGIERAV